MKRRLPGRRMLRRPLASLVLAGLLAADAAWVAGPPGPMTSAGGELAWWAARWWRMDRPRRLVVAEVGRLFHLRSEHPGPFGLPDLPDGMFVLRGEHPAQPLVLIDQDTASWNDLSRWMAESPSRLAAVRATCGVRRDGWWALTREQRVDTVALEPMGRGGFDEVAVGRVRALLAAHGWGGAPDGPADQSASRVLWWGYVHNLVSLAVLAAFVCSLGWVRDVPGWVRRRRGARRVSRGVCPACAYPLLGLEEGVCPECGAVIADWAPRRRRARAQRRG